MRLLVPLPLLALVLAACAESPTDAPIDLPSAGEPVVYARHIQPILDRSCATSGCHAGSSPAAGLSLTSWERVMAGAESGAVVVPFAARKSHLLQHISTDTTIAPTAEPHMPLDRGSLPREQILAIARWITEGARSDAGAIALDGDRPRVFVASQGEDLLSVIDLGTLRLARFVSVGRLSDAGSPPEAPHNVALSPDGRYVYVNLIATGEIEKFDAVTFAKLGSAAVGRSPAQIAVSDDGSTLYVSNFDQTLSQRFISKVDASSLATISTFDCGGLAPHGVTLSRDGRMVYTTNAASDDISVIDPASGDVLRVIPATPGAPLPPGTSARLEPYQSVLNADGGTLWFTCRAGAQVRAIDLATGRVVDSVTVGTRPLILEITPDGRELWVPNQQDGTVSIIDVATRRVIATVSGLRSQPHAVAFTADGRTAFVTCENQTGSGHHPVAGMKTPGLVYVIDTATRAIVRTIEVGAFAAGIVVRG